MANPINAYTAELARRLRWCVPGSLARKTVEEVRCHLLLSAAEVGEEEAVKAFGPAADFATKLIREERIKDWKALAVPVVLLFATETVPFWATWLHRYIEINAALSSLFLLSLLVAVLVRKRWLALKLVLMFGVCILLMTPLAILQITTRPKASAIDMSPQFLREIAEAKLAMKGHPIEEAAGYDAPKRMDLITAVKVLPLIPFQITLRSETTYGLQNLRLDPAYAKLSKGQLKQVADSLWQKNGPLYIQDQYRQLAEYRKLRNMRSNPWLPWWEVALDLVAQIAAIFSINLLGLTMAEAISRIHNRFKTTGPSLAGAVLP